MTELKDHLELLAQLFSLADPWKRDMHNADCIDELPATPCHYVGGEDSFPDDFAALFDQVVVPSFSDKGENPLKEPGNPGNDKVRIYIDINMCFRFS